ncbi:glycosyltransferase [Butyricicoccus faecihominis]|uniref:glycosyltransferase n=1 Tax=Butyricicoccus faecihominis TaxID=1712515 RepID=UPI002479796A|nr:glycosyltransferase [Butyricicoccus faecihominis]MCQ5128152.1 glycosyltransferase [Butyricicoccus faecihominis]
MLQVELIPNLSVIMGVYYQSDDVAKLRRSVTSILLQTYREFELLICDDGSSKAAQELLSELAKADRRIRLIRCGNLIGLPAKLNACLQEAKGIYIARMDDDDYSHVDRFEKQMQFLSENNNVGFVGCNVNLYCAGKIVGKRKLPEYPTVYDFLFVQPYIHPTLIFRREILEMVDGYSENKYCALCEDYDLLLRIYENGYHGANIQEIIFDYSVPTTVKGKRRMSARWNETVTRFRHFRLLHLLPKAWPYVFKPLLVGLMPAQILRMVKKRHDGEYKGDI